ncbi:hypothetical protein N8388_04790 [Octadecabacter sp.]|nr:hypothetical protein [Octadecabacter sp.]
MVSGKDQGSVTPWFIRYAPDGLIGEDDGKTFATPVETIGQAEHQVIL